VLVRTVWMALGGEKGEMDRYVMVIVMGS